MEQLRFTAPNLPDAMAKVRDELGKNASIISWNNLGNEIEVIATAPEQEKYEPLSEFRTEGSSPRYDIFAREEELLQQEELERQKKLTSIEKAKRQAKDSAASFAPNNQNPIINKNRGVNILLNNQSIINQNLNSLVNGTQENEEKEEILEEPQEKTTKTKIHPLIPILVNCGLTIKEVSQFAKMLEDIEENPKDALFNIIDKNISFNTIPQVPDHVIALVGPSGAGKTATAAKLAARALAANAEVLLVSTDTSRQGGIEQLRGFAKKLSAGFNYAENITEAVHLANNGLDAGKVVIFDCAQSSLFDPSSMRVTESLVDETKAEPILCLPSDIRTDDAKDFCNEFKNIGVFRSIITRMDLTKRRAGSIIALMESKIEVAQLSASPFVAGGLAIASAQRLTDLIMDI